MQSVIREEISELKKSLEDLECELKREKTKKRNVNQAAVQKYQSHITHHHWHISNLEKVLRQIDNHIIDPYDVESITDGVHDYITSFKDANYHMDEEMYSGFDLSTIPEIPDNDTPDQSDSSSTTDTKSVPAVAGVRWDYE